MKVKLIAPNSINKPRRIHTIDGKYRKFTVVDEIHCEQKVREKKTHKLIFFQKIKFEDGEIQYRFTYYMFGLKKGARGRWVFGQYSLMIPVGKLSYLLREARKRKWKGV
jgi:hypothetical protein